MCKNYYNMYKTIIFTSLNITLWLPADTFFPYILII